MFWTLWNFESIFKLINYTTLHYITRNNIFIQSSLIHAAGMVKFSLLMSFPRGKLAMLLSRARNYRWLFLGLARALERDSSLLQKEEEAAALAASALLLYTHTYKACALARSISPFIPPARGGAASPFSSGSSLSLSLVFPRERARGSRL